MYCLSGGGPGKPPDPICGDRWLIPPAPGRLNFSLGDRQPKLSESNACTREKGAMAEGRRSTAQGMDAQGVFLYSNSMVNTRIQLLKMNTFNGNRQIFTKDNNSKCNDNNVK